MTQWAYMLVTSEVTNSGVEIKVADAPNYQLGTVDPDGKGMEELRVFDQLGEEGWELVSVDESDNRSRYWMKRLVPEEGVGEIGEIPNISLGI
ncbi:hypothetical protein [Modestobacter sp. SSW1-42]|uniref:hypothetical protein n=1 Tax=Modestobacter sp. SSW1-42 TaxID=596372 RepID=UPI0039876FF8